MSGKGITTFGTKFTQAKVLEHASSSVQLVANTPATRLASGVLIAPQVVLCAAHTIEAGISGKIQMLMGFECDAKTAPPGAFFQYEKNKRPWPSCTELATTPQATEVKVLEIERSGNLDYAMILIQWNNVQNNVVKLPRVPIFPKPGRNFTQELVLVGHPQDKGSPRQGEQTQACAFKLLKTRGPHPGTGQGDVYCYGEFGFVSGEGFSGGGVFNEQGDIVGLLKGSPGNALSSQGLSPNHFAFLDLGLASDHTMNDPVRGRLKLWFNTGSPLKQSDNVGPNPTFQKA